MREIKFRAWDKYRKKLISNILTIKIHRVTGEPCLIVYTDKKMNPHQEIKETDKIYCNEFELIQYTGLKDKNRKEIYEGDIIKAFQPFNVPQKAIVEFNDGCFDLKGIELTWRDYVKCFVVNHAIEVIGNIHENSELLEVEE